MPALGIVLTISACCPTIVPGWGANVCEDAVGGSAELGGGDGITYVDTASNGDSC